MALIVCGLYANPLKRASPASTRQGLRRRLGKHELGSLPFFKTLTLLSCSNAVQNTWHHQGDVGY